MEKEQKLAADLFQGFLGPKLLKNIENYKFWGFEDGVPPGPYGLPSLSEDPGLTTYFFLSVMGWGDGDIQMSRRRRRRSSEAPRSSPRLPEAPQKRQKRCHSQAFLLFEGQKR